MIKQIYRYLVFICVCMFIGVLQTNDLMAQSSVKSLVLKQKETQPSNQENAQDSKSNAENTQKTGANTSFEEQEKALKEKADLSFSEGNFSQALQYLQSAYEINRNPRYLANQGLVLIEMKDYAQALSLLEAFIESNPEPAKKEAAMVHIKKLMPEVSLQSDPVGVEVLLNQGSLGRTPFKKKLVAGTHELTLRKTGYETQKVTLIVPVGKSTSAHYTMEVQNKRIDQKSMNASSTETFRPITLGPTVLLVTAGLSTALSIGSIFLTRDAVINRNDAVNQTVWQKQQDDAQFYQSMTSTAMIAGGLTLGLGLAWWLFWSEPEDPNSPFLRFKGTGFEGRF